MTTKELFAIAEVLKPENYVSIRELQKSPTKSLQTSGYKIIMNNGKPMGLYMSMDKFEAIQEEMAMLSNEKHLKDIEEARNDNKEYSRDEVIKMFNLNI